MHNKIQSNPAHKLGSIIKLINNNIYILSSETVRIPVEFDERNAESPTAALTVVQYGREN